MLVTACDENYLSEARTLMRSCARHEPDQRFYLFLVNGGSIPDGAIKKWHPRTIVERVTWPHDNERWRGIMCAARSVPVVTVLETYREPTIYLDSDTLLRRPLTEAFRSLESCDLMVKFRPDLDHIGAAGTPHASKFNSGVIAIRPSEAGIHFAREYDRLLRAFFATGRPVEIYRRDLGLRFIVDQELLYVCYLRLRDRLVFLPLPDKFNDARFHASSVIWHGKGSARKHPQYLLEKLRQSSPLLFHLGGALGLAMNQLRLARKGLRARKRLV